MRTFLRSDDGLTLVELVVVSALTLIVLFSAISLLEGATKSERGTQARTQLAAELRQAMTQTTKLTRQALSIDLTSTTSRLAMSTLVGGATHHVVIDVSSGGLRLTDDTSGVGPTVILERITNAQSFCYMNTVGGSCDLTPTTPTAVRISLAASPGVTAGGSITLTSDVDLRNVRS